MAAREAVPLKPFVPPVPMSPALYLGLFVLLLFAYLGGVLLAGMDVQAQLERGRIAPPSIEQPYVLWYALAGVALLATAVLGFFFVYRIWAALRSGPASMGPGEAVGMLLLPIVNLIWMFFAYCGWARDFNRFIQARNLDVAPASRTLPLLFCLAVLANLLVAVLVLARVLPPLVSLVTGGAGVFMTALFWGNAISAVNDLAVAKAEMVELPEPVED